MGLGSVDVSQMFYLGTKLYPVVVQMDGEDNLNIF